MILMCVIVLAVHSNCHPYKKARVNITESVYLMILCLLTIMQIFPDSNDKYSSKNIVCLIFLIILSIHTCLLTLCKAIRFFGKRFGFAVPGISNQDGVTQDPLGDSLIEQSLDTEDTRRRDVLDTIFSTASGESNRSEFEKCVDDQKE